LSFVVENAAFDAIEPLVKIAAVDASAVYCVNVVSEYEYPPVPFIRLTRMFESDLLVVMKYT